MSQIVPNLSHHRTRHIYKFVTCRVDGEWQVEFYHAQYIRIFRKVPLPARVRLGVLGARLCSSKRWTVRSFPNGVIYSKATPQTRNVGELYLHEVERIGGIWWHIAEWDVQKHCWRWPSCAADYKQGIPWAYGESLLDCPATRNYEQAYQLAYNWFIRKRGRP